MRPFIRKASGRWCVQYAPRYSHTGKRQAVYYGSEQEAQKDLADRRKEWEKHGSRVMQTGRERSLSEYRALLKEAGFRLDRSSPIRSSMAVLEAVAS